MAQGPGQRGVSQKGGDRPMWSYMSGWYEQQQWRDLESSQFEAAAAAMCARSEQQGISDSGVMGQAT